MPSILQSFLPLHSPMGFGAADFIELFLALGLVVMALVWRPRIERACRWLAGRTLLCMVVLAALPVALRLLLLPNHRVPAPDIYDEFGHLLVADTLRHFRFANSAHPLSQFFETFFTLQHPTYSSIYPIGQGLMLALGRAIFGHPWAGVVLATAAFCALTYWMLRAWVSPMWALAGGLLAICEFGPLCQWMNNYWGGAFGAAVGCLVFGALPRLVQTPRRRYAILLGVGLGLHLLLRPFESVFLFICVALYLAPFLRSRQLLLRLPITVVLVAFAFGVTLLQNKSVTGNWAQLPYQLSQYQYGVPAALTFQDNPAPHVPLTPQLEMGYKSQLAFRSAAPETLGSYVQRLGYRVRYYRFFFLPPLYVALVAFLLAIWRREEIWKWAWVVFTLTAFALGTNFFPAFQLQYLAAVTCLFVLASVVGLRQIARWSPESALLLLFLCGAHFVFWYGMHVFDNEEFSQTARPYETWDAINHRNPERRLAVNEQLAAIRGKLVVLVRYWPQHLFQDEWVYNDADIDGSRLVWARDLGEPENGKLREYYKDRKIWLLEPDARPPKLTPYVVEVPPESVAPVVTDQKKKNAPTQPKLMFEDVPR